MQFTYDPNVKVSMEVPDEWDTIPPAVQAELTQRMNYAIGSLLFEVAAPWHFNNPGPDYPCEIAVSCYAETPDEYDAASPESAARFVGGYMVAGSWNYDGCSGFSITRYDEDLTRHDEDLGWYD